MNHLDQTYTPAFFEKHLEWKAEYETQAQWLADNLDFESAVDFGCGNALILTRLLALGKKVHGIDGSRNAFQYASPEIRPYLAVMDLRVLISSYADLVICTEVAEHLHAEHADTLVESLAFSARKWIYFTAATPGQGGTDHVNEQPHGYWIEKFLGKGFDLVTHTARFREHLRARLKQTVWFPANAMIFRRATPE